jgi:hypothetical protein
MKNGELLQLAARQFDLLLTVDRNLEYQQHDPAQKSGLPAVGTGLLP